eukprot:TRINITY_DN880_c0_g1_i9.p1 TRINITY_DN880_c0_g1~~TRINITY_DN880_c0_g1_i9.p1  ORF type:complete len:322 (-),score=102.57 TRINITY_DN880_c0_g1_i9:78-1043(-)
MFFSGIDYDYYLFGPLGEILVMHFTFLPFRITFLMNMMMICATIPLSFMPKYGAGTLSGIVILSWCFTAAGYTHESSLKSAFLCKMQTHKIEEAIEKKNQQLSMFVGARVPKDHLSTLLSSPITSFVAEQYPAVVVMYCNIMLGDYVYGDHSVLLSEESLNALEEVNMFLSSNVPKQASWRATTLGTDFVCISEIEANENEDENGEEKIETVISGVTDVFVELSRSLVALFSQKYPTVGTLSIGINVDTLAVSARRSDVFTFNAFGPALELAMALAKRSEVTKNTIIASKAAAEKISQTLIGQSFAFEKDGTTQEAFSIVC